MLNGLSIESLPDLPAQNLAPGGLGADEAPPTAQRIATGRENDRPTYESLPEPSPIDMPVQAIRGWTGLRDRNNGLLKQWFTTSDFAMHARRIVLLWVTAMPAIAVFLTLNARLADGGYTGFEVAYVALFVPLFAWITFGFMTSLVGFSLLVAGQFRRRRQRGDDAAPRGRTAILLPVCNEDFGPVLERLVRMTRSFDGVAGREKFEFFILSDSAPAGGEAEARAYRATRARFALPVHYRRRANNVGRKPGNVAEWVRRFGGAFDYMVVLDADSLMGGRTMAQLAVDMDAHPHMGLIQTVPMITNAQTLFSRWHQFAARLYGSVGTAGLIWWSHSDGNFWGHNAIVRVEAFATSCGLPELRGPAPFGGHIMSHDMVEAALLRRRGWAVHMVMMDDSFEEFPPSLTDLATRDRRWCQGNMQHIPLIFARGFHLVNRFHLLVGASAYITSPLWLALIAIVLAAGQIEGAGDLVASGNALLAVTVILLMGPKLFGLLWTAIDPTRRYAFGGLRAMLKGAFLETALSILMAPISMLTQTIDIFGILSGRKSPWNGQNRDRDGIPLLQAIWDYRYHVLAGIGIGALSWHSTSELAWLSPVIAGLLCAPLIAAVTARRDVGNWFVKRGVFVVPATNLSDESRYANDPKPPKLVVV